MSLSKTKIGGEKSKQDNQDDFSRFQAMEKAAFSDFQALLEQHAGLSSEKQLLFGYVIGSNAWQLDMTQGNITFGNLSFPIQIIGSLSFGNNSWMWGWANTQSGIPENLLVQSNQLKKIGQEKGIEELVKGHFNVEPGFEHKIGIIACGIFNSKSYYCANYGQGTLVVTIDDKKIPEVNLDQIVKVLTSFPQLLSGMELNHKNALLNYLIDREFKICIAGNEIEGLRNKQVLVGEFDELDRLKSLQGKV